MNGKYWDKPWSLIDGCTPCSPGCDHCWSMAMGKRFGKWPDKMTPRPDRLDIPLRVKKPTVWAIWNDLFHEHAPDGFIDCALGVMASCSRHTFLALTKRPDRMLRYMTTEDGGREPQTGCGTWRSVTLQALDVACEAIIKNPKSTTGDDVIIGENALLKAWPLPNLWLGVTVCNQAEADEKIPLLLRTPAAHRWVSIEPMLGEIDVSPYLSHETMCPRCGWIPLEGMSKYLQIQFPAPTCIRCGVSLPPPSIDAIVLGGETGPGARPMHPDWVRKVRDDCAEAGVPFFFKGWGEWVPCKYREYNCWQYPDQGYIARDLPDGRLPGPCDSRGCWGPEELEAAGCAHVTKIGHKKAGRLLDGREHNDLPWRKP